MRTSMVAPSAGSAVLLAAASLAVGAAAAPAVSPRQAGSICHVLTYAGSCGNLTSLEANMTSNASSSSSALSASTSASSSAATGASCVYSSVCLVPSLCNSTLLANSVDSSTGLPLVNSSAADAAAKATGCVAFQDMGMQMESLGMCDGQRYLLGGTNMAYQCICNDVTDSCPAEGVATSTSYASGAAPSTSSSPNGTTSSQSDIGLFTWTWGPSSSASGSGLAPTQAISSPSTNPALPSARTTFHFTFQGSNSQGASSAASTGLQGLGSNGNQQQQAKLESSAAYRQTQGAVTMLALAVTCASTWTWW